MYGTILKSIINIKFKYIFIKNLFSFERKDFKINQKSNPVTQICYLIKILRRLAYRTYIFLQYQTSFELGRTEEFGWFSIITSFVWIRISLFIKSRFNTWVFFYILNTNLIHFFFFLPQVSNTYENQTWNFSLNKFFP